MNDYFSIADSDYKWIPYLMQGALEIKNYNLVIVQLQQVAEKYLKGYIDAELNISGKYDKELRSHNFRKLVGVINAEKGAEIDSIRAKYLGDFYYDARYPGDNYLVVADIATAQTCIEICDEIMTQIRSLQAKKENPTEYFKEL